MFSFAAYIDIYFDVNFDRVNEEFFLEKAKIFLCNLVEYSRQKRIEKFLKYLSSVCLFHLLSLGVCWKRGFALRYFREM